MGSGHGQLVPRAPELGVFRTLLLGGDKGPCLMLPQVRTCKNKRFWDPHRVKQENEGQQGGLRISKLSGGAGGEHTGKVGTACATQEAAGGLWTERPGSRVSVRVPITAHLTPFPLGSARSHRTNPTCLLLPTRPAAAHQGSGPGCTAVPEAPSESHCHSPCPTRHGPCGCGRS